MLKISQAVKAIFRGELICCNLHQKDYSYKKWRLPLKLWPAEGAGEIFSGPGKDGKR
jgi:hypothetical protein